jgi:hypothetical protein
MGRKIVSMCLVAATLYGSMALPAGAAEDKTDWSKYAWVPLKGPSSWSEWQFNPAKEKRTWKYVEELTQAEKEYWQIDPRWSHDLPRDKERPWLPAQRYPFKLPYSGEALAALGESGGGGSVMCGLQTHYGYHITRKQDQSGVISKADTICSTIKHYKTFAEGLYKFKPGDEQGAQLVVTTSPPEQNGNVTLNKFYVGGPGINKLIDQWTYTRQQRRVRRVAGASGTDYSSGGIGTIDDSFTRSFWQYDSKVIGVDVLYDVVSEKKPYGDIKGPVTPYRKDGGVECYVVLSKPRQKGYYLSQWVTWHEKKTLHVLRTEQWSRNGNFKQISEKAPYIPVRYFGTPTIPWVEAIKGGTNAQGAERRAILHGGGKTITWDAEMRVTSFGLGDTPDTRVPLEKFGNLDVYPGGQNWKEWFQTQRLDQPFVKPSPVVNFTAKDFPAIPPLYREKFPKYRKVLLPADLQEKIKKEEQKKRGLFSQN